MSQSCDTIVISGELIREESPAASMSLVETNSELVAGTPLKSTCNVGTRALQEPVSSTGQAQVSFWEEMRALQSPISSIGAAQFSVWEENGRTSEHFVALSEVVQELGSICNTKSESSVAPMSSIQTRQLISREKRTRISERIGALSEVFDGLENFCLLEECPGVHPRCSPLPLWYPRRPLQDITAVLNISPVPPEEASNLKKSKKVQPVQTHGHLYDNRGASGQRRAPRIPFKPTTFVPAACKRSSQLRRGFR